MKLWLYDHVADWSLRCGDWLSSPFYRLSNECTWRWHQGRQQLDKAWVEHRARRLIIQGMRPGLAYDQARAEARELRRQAR